MIEKEPSLEAVKDYVRREYKRGLTAEGCIGLHGTSLETLQYLLQRGVLPGETRETWTAHDSGDVFFETLVKPGEISPVDMQMAIWYGNKNGKRHWLSAQLGLDFATTHQDEAMIDFLLRYETKLADPIYEKLFSVRGWDSVQVKELISRAKQQQGVILGIQSQVSEKYLLSNLSPLGSRVDGVRIMTAGKGLPFSDIIGILPLGEREKAYLDSL